MADYKGGGLPPATTPAEVERNLKVYADAYLKHADELRSNSYTASDTVFAGGLLGIMGGIGKAPEAAIAGALLSGGGSSAEARYQYQVQALNYEKAADALYCMRRQIYTKLSLFDVSKANDRIDTIRRTLRTVQAQVSLASADLAGLEAALKKLIPAQEEAEKQRPAIEQARLAWSDANIELSQLQVVAREKERDASDAIRNTERLARELQSTKEVESVSGDLARRRLASQTRSTEAEEIAADHREAVNAQYALVQALEQKLIVLREPLREEVEAQLDACAAQL